MEQYSTALLIGKCCSKLFILDVCGGPGYTSGNSEKSATGKITTCEECNKRRMQNENTATCKRATWNRAIHKKSTTREKMQHEKITTQKSATWKWCSMKKKQHEKSTIWKNINWKHKYGKSAQK